MPQFSYGPYFNAAALSIGSRCYLPRDFDPYKESNVTRILNRLTQHPPTHFTQAADWFGLFHELSCCVSQAHVLLEVQCQQDVRNQRAKQALQTFEGQILTQVMACKKHLMSLYLDSPFILSMHPYDGGRAAKDLAARKQFAHPHVIQLQQEESKLARLYKEKVNEKRVDWQGKQVPLATVGGQKNHPDPVVRKQAFFLYWQVFRHCEQEFQDIFDALLRNRRDQAQCAGVTHYADIAFAEMGRLDYGLSQCAQFRSAILDVTVPVLKDLSVPQLKSLQASSLAPWESHLWPHLLPENAPAQGNSQRWLQDLEKIVTQIAKPFGHLFCQMRDQKLWDVFPRPHKASGAFCAVLHDSRVPFLFANLGPNTQDTLTFIHEFGHALHSFAFASIPNILLRQPGFEMCELASMGLELLASPFWDILWPQGNDAKKVLQYQLFQMLQFWPTMALLDEWQHVVYGSSHVLSAAERNEVWTTLSGRYRPHWDWSLCPSFEPLGWLARSHVFVSPFYFIDYGLAQVGALQLWQHSKHKYTQAVGSYIKGLSLGAQVDLPSLYQTMGVVFDTGPESLRTLCQNICHELSPL